jgi:hypothetical protein
MGSKSWRRKAGKKTGRKSKRRDEEERRQELKLGDGMMGRGDRKQKYKK